MTTIHSSIALVLESREEESFWKGIFASQGLSAFAIAAGTGGARALGADARLANCLALVADASALLAAGVTPAALAAVVAERSPRLKLFVRLAQRVGVSPPEQAWAHGSGIASLLPGSTAAAWRESILPVVARVLEHLDDRRVDEAGLKKCVDSLVASGAEPRQSPVNDIHTDAYRLERQDLNPSRIFERMQAKGAVQVADRVYRGKKYESCFVAAEAIDWITRDSAVERLAATRVATFLWRTGRVHHVVRDAAFADAFLFFRFGGTRSELDRVDLAQIEADLRTGRGPAIADRAWLGQVYARCFVGSEAVDWLVRTRGISRGAAETAGHRLLDLGVFHHVRDEHGFVGDNYFYRLRDDEHALLPA